MEPALGYGGAARKLSHKWCEFGLLGSPSQVLLLLSVAAAQGWIGIALALCVLPPLSLDLGDTALLLDKRQCSQEVDSGSDSVESRPCLGCGLTLC